MAPVENIGGGYLGNVVNLVLKPCLTNLGKNIRTHSTRNSESSVTHVFCDS